MKGIEDMKDNRLDEIESILSQAEQKQKSNSVEISHAYHNFDGYNPEWETIFKFECDFQTFMFTFCNTDCDINESLLKNHLNISFKYSEIKSIRWEGNTIVITFSGIV